MRESIGHSMRSRTQLVVFGLVMFLAKDNQVFIQFVPRFAGRIVAMVNI